MGKGPFKLKGSPMQRNFGIGEKESPLKLEPLTTALIGAGVSALIGGGVSVGIASSKAKQEKRKKKEEKAQLALKEAEEGISEEIEGKTDLLKA